jgi:hypothetical protein
VARVVNEVRSYKLAREAAGRPTWQEARHRAQALVAGAGMRAEPVLGALRRGDRLRPSAPGGAAAHRHPAP